MPAETTHPASLKRQSGTRYAHNGPLSQEVVDLEVIQTIERPVGNPALGPDTRCQVYEVEFSAAGMRFHCPGESASQQRR